MIRFLLFLLCAAAYSQGIITTVAGTDITYPGTSFSANSASFGQLGGVAVNPITGAVYFASRSRSLIVKFDPLKNSTTIVAGVGITGDSGDGGPAAQAALDSPSQIVFDSAGNLYTAEAGGCRKIDTQGIITTVVGKIACSGVAVAPDGTLYFAAGNQLFRLSSAGASTVLAGSTQAGYSGDGGPATSARLNLNGSVTIVFDGAGNLLFTDVNNHAVRRIGTDGKISTVAGTGKLGGPVPGPATASPLEDVGGLAVDKSGNVFAGFLNQGLVQIDAKGVLSVLSNDGGTIPVLAPTPVKNTTLWPAYMAFDASGNLYIADSIVGCLYRLSSGTVQLVAGYAPNFGIGDNGPGLSAGLNFPRGLGLMPDGSILIADALNHRVRRLSPSGTMTTAVGSGAFNGIAAPGFATSIELFGVTDAVSDSVGNIYVATCGVTRVGSYGNAVPFSSVCADYLAVDTLGNVLGSNSTDSVVYKYAANGSVTAIAGNGQVGFSGDGGPATSAALSLNDLSGLAVCPDGSLYLADSGNNRIRRVAPSGIISTVAGGGPGAGDGVPATQTSLNFLSALACDQHGNVYLTDGSRVREITTDGMIHAIAGTGQYAFRGDGGPATSAVLNGPTGLAVDGAGNVFVSDTGNNRIREILAVAPSLSVATSQVTLNGVSGGSQVTAGVAVNSSVKGLTFSIAYALTSGDDWLSVAPSGIAPGVLTIAADPSSLQPGTYQGTVTLSNPSAVPNTVTVAVTFQVGAAQPRSLSVQTQSLSFAFGGSGGQQSQQLSVSNQGSGTVSFTATAATSSGGSWLSVAPSNGTASNAVPANLTVIAAAGTLGPGTYSGSVTIASADTGQSLILPVTLSVSAAQQKILLSQTGLSFTAVAQGGSLLPQDFGILNVGQGAMSWTARASTLSGGSWLGIDQTSGTVSQPFLDVSMINVSISPTGLGAGTYYGQIQVIAPGATNSPQSVSVQLSVLPAGSNPGPEVRPTGVIFIGTQGNSPGSQSVMVANPAAAAVTFSASPTYLSASGWLQYLPSSATVAAGQPTEMIVQPNFTSLPAGVQRAAMTMLFSDGSVRNVGVLTVVAPPSPSGVNAGLKPEAAGNSCNPLLVQPTSLTDQAASVSVGQAVYLAVRVADNCGNPVTSSSGTVVATFSSGDTPVNLVHIGNGYWNGTWTPRNASQARVTIRINAIFLQLNSSAGGSTDISVAVQNAATAPLTFGAVNAASGVGAFISPGGLVSIYGQQMADQAAQPGAAPFPTQLNGTQVLMGGTALPLRYVGNGQVNAQVPFGLGINTPQQLIVQRDATLSVPQDVVVAAAQPAVYTQNQSGTGAGVIVNGITNALITPANPAHAGDVVVIYCNGLGAVNPAVPTGTPAPASGPLSLTVSPLTVMIGGVTAQVNFAGLAPGFPDLYQVNVVVPAGVAPGDQMPIVLTIAGQTSPAVTIAVR